MKSNIKVIFIAIIITCLFIGISIPKFIKISDLNKLSNKLEKWPDYADDKNNHSSDFNDDYFEDDISYDKDSNKNEENNNTNNDEINKNENNEENRNNDIENNPEIEKPLKTFTATFKNNGDYNIKEMSLSCSTTNNTCQITLPYVNTDREFLGWSLDAKVTSTNQKSGSIITLDKNKVYYAITKKNYSVTINGNGAFLGNKIETCSIYNTMTNCQITLPDLKKDYYTVLGYNYDSNSDEIIFNTNQTIVIENNLNLFAVRKIDPTNYYAYQNISLEVYNKINELRQKNGLNKLNFNKSLELSSMLRLSEIAKDYNYNVNGDYHVRISNNEPFYTVNEYAYAENYFRANSCDATYFHDSFVNSPSHLNNLLRSDLTDIGISVSNQNGKCYIVELFGIK